MAKTLQFRRGTTSELSTITGAVGELFVDTTKDTLVVMDGVTAGGFPLAKESQLVSLAGYATESYVNNQINNILDGAPNVLNTLNELAAAIGDDANFITNINASIATKANSSSLSSVALSGSYNDLTNKPTLSTVSATGQYSDLLGKPTLVDLAEVSEDIIPMFSEVFDIGTPTKRWYNGYFSDTIDINSNILSGLQSGVLSTSSNFSADALLSNTALIGQILISDNFITPDNGTESEYFGNKGTLVVNGNLNVIGDWLNVPVVESTTTATPSTVGSEGFIRFNKDTTSFEGYDGVKWGSLGGIEADDNGNATIEANLIVNGSGQFTSLSITNAATIGGGATITGNLVVSGDVISLSDETKKENITKVQSALNIINQINGVYYNLKDNPEKRHVGVIAQNVEIVLPEVVYEKDGTKSVAYGNIVGVLIEAIKEQQIQIEELKAKINGI